MALTRGQFIGGAVATVGGLALSGCTEAVRRFASPEPPVRVEAGDADPAIWRALNRLTFGPRPGDVQRVAAHGLDAFVEEQLAPERLDEGYACMLRLGTLDTLDMDPDDARDYETANYPEVGKGQAAVELQQAAVIRAVYSERQLLEVMSDFWANHFNVSQLKADCSWLKTMDDRSIRKHALGRFRDLVAASSHSAGMLFYLDNDKNRKRDPRTRSGPNENYARELLELHTLGVNGGYTLGDVQEVARCFSGWGFKTGFGWQPGEFEFHPSAHDDGPKRVLGVHLPAGRGIRDGERVIDVLCAHPSTARFIARKLCRRFVADRPADALVSRVADAFARSGGEIRQVLSVLFHSPEFRRGTARRLKRPFDYAVSALRVTCANTTGHGILPHLERMGQLPYKWTMPDGYPDRAEAWAPGMLARWNFALDLAHGRLGATSVPVDGLVRATARTEPAAIVRALSQMVLGRALPETLLRSLAVLGAESPAGERRYHAHRQWMALLLASPQFQWR